MPPLALVTYPSAILTTPTQKVSLVTPDIQQLVENMVATMRAQNGVGLAAPQIGQSLRIAVLEHVPGPKEDPSTAVPLQILINPKIISKTGGTEVEEEGCLSIPGIEVPVARARKIKVKALNERGEAIQFRASGFHARIIQHELDHLDGRLIIDYVSNRDALLATYQADQGHAE